MQTRRAAAFLTSAFSLLMLVAAPPPASASGPDPRGDLLGRRLPGETPELFAPGLVSTDLCERDLAVSPDGNEVWWTLQGGGSYSRWFATLVFSRREGGRWSAPRVAPFSGRHRDLEPSFSPDGRRLWFASDRALAGDSAKRDFDLWVVERTGSGWGSPRNAGAVVNTDQDEFYPSQSRDGALFFTATRPDGRGGEDIVRAPAEGGGFGAPAPLDSVDTAAGEYNACVSPDGGTLVFGRAGGLFVSFRRPEGTWTAGHRLEGALDSPNLDYCPSLSPDGRFLFFTSTRPPEVEVARTPPGFEALLAAVPDPAHRRLLRTRLFPYEDVYWVDAGFLDGLRERALGTR